jgi:acetyl esterase/lipase
MDVFYGTCTNSLPRPSQPLKLLYNLDCLAGPPADPELSPLLADHNGLPPTHLQICGLDPLRDEGLLYERLLREQGILTRLDMRVHPFFAARELAHFPHRYPGVPHGFSSMLPEMTATKKWDADLRE